MTRIKTLLILLSLGVMILSCGKSSKKDRFEYAGNSFYYALDIEPSIFSPKDVTDFYSGTILDQIYQGLVSLNPKTLEVEACIAKSWTLSENGKAIEFELRDDVYFHTNHNFTTPVKVSVEDVIFSVELACTPVNGKESLAYTMIYKNLLKGAEAFFLGETDHIEGLSAKGNLIKMELMEVSPNFINKLAIINAAIVSKKAVAEGYENALIGTGPFRYSQTIDKDGQAHWILVRNETYFEKDANGKTLPYLDSLVFIIENRKLQQLDMFENGVIQLIDGMPPSRISRMLEGKLEDFNKVPPQLILVREPILGTQFYAFNLLQEKFQDVRVRKAINYALDKNVIIRNILNYQAFGIGDGGIVPPAGFNGYDSKKVKGYSYQPEKAKKLLADAGYPNGEGFPSINLKFNLGTYHSAVADEVASQLSKTLNINVNLDGMEFRDMLEDQRKGEGDIFRTSWYADYYSPESFLQNAYGKDAATDNFTSSTINIARYHNPKFDALFEMGKKSSSILDRYKYFAEAEDILMKDAPYIILWYDETIKILYSNVRNLHFNEMNQYSFKEVYFKDWTEDEWELRQE